MPTLLVIDDDQAILDCMRLVFPESEFNYLTATTAADGLASFARHRPEVVLSDIHLPDMTGLETFRRIHALDAKTPVILMTGAGTTDTAIEAMALGAFEYLLKPVEFARLRELVDRAFETSRQMRVAPVLAGEASDAVESGDLLVGKCAAMQEVYKAIGRVAQQNVTVLILGESGTGKELVARAIYHYSRRAAGPFLAINCAAIPEALLESELFGHEKGSFTGAERKRVGKFEQCSGGTLFLDEIGDMTPLTQTKILRVLQDQQFERVGGNETIRTDVRLIAATNRDLEKLVEQGQFRRDLYYRLNVYTIRLPALRERTEDLPILLAHFLKRFGRELGKEVHNVAPDVLELFRHYSWPGNMRELQSVLKQAILQARGPILMPESLTPVLRGQVPSPPADLSPDALDYFIQQRLQAGSTDLHAEWLAITEGHLFSKILAHTSGNLSQAARILGIHRATLRTKLTALGIDPDNPAPQRQENISV